MSCLDVYKRQVMSFLKYFSGVCPLKDNNKGVSDGENFCEAFSKYFQTEYQPNIISKNNLNTNEDCINDNISIPVLTN